MAAPLPTPPAASRAAEDVAIARRIADRRPEALGELYDRHAPLLLALAERILGQRGDAEEVLQEAFLQVWGQADRYDPRRSSVLTWLVLLTRSRAIDRLRSRQAGERRAVASDARDPEPRHASPAAVESVLSLERRERVQQALGELPAEQRQVLELAFYGGLSQSEIAAQTGVPLGTIKTRSLLAMKKLRQTLRKDIRELL